MLEKVLKDYVKSFKNTIENNMDGETKKKLQLIDEKIPEDYPVEMHHYQMLKAFTRIMFEEEVDFKYADDVFKNVVDTTVSTGQKLCEKIVIEAVLKTVNGKALEKECVRIIEIPGSSTFVDLACFLLAALDVTTIAPFTFKPIINSVPEIMDDDLFEGKEGTVLASDMYIDELHPGNLDLLEFHYKGNDEELVFSLRYVSTMTAKKWVLSSEAEVLSGTGCVLEHKNDTFDLKSCNAALEDNYEDLYEIYMHGVFSDEDPEDVGLLN